MNSIAPVYSQSGSVNLERDGIVYSVGSIQRVTQDVAMIDLGAIHQTELDDRLVVFQRDAGFYKPVGILRVAEVEDATCRTEPFRRVKLSRGDVVMRVHEFSDLLPYDRFEKEFLRGRILRKSRGTGTSTVDDLTTADKLVEYKKKYPQWERGNADNLGYLNGSSWSSKHERFIDPLVRQIDLLRNHYSQGRKTLPALGSDWVECMSVLSGRLATERHQASQIQTTGDDVVAQETQVTPIVVQRLVSKAFFDRTSEEKKFIAFVVLTGVDAGPRRIDLWVQLQFQRSQFTETLEEKSTLKKISQLIRELRQ